MAMPLKRSESLREGVWPSLFLFVFGHEIHQNFFCHFLVGGKGYFGSVFSFKTNAHWFRNLFFGLKLYVMPLWSTHLQYLHYDLLRGRFQIVSYFQTLSQRCRELGSFWGFSGGTSGGTWIGDFGRILTQPGF